MFGKKKETPAAPASSALGALKQFTAAMDAEDIKYRVDDERPVVRVTYNGTNYERLTFDGIQIVESYAEDGTPIMRKDVLAIYVDIYFNEDIDYGKDALGTLLIYVWGNERKVLCDTLTNKDLQALIAYGQK